jgi:serine phosphatase RsbU (regulator of sigma subunit)
MKKVIGPVLILFCFISSFAQKDSIQFEELQKSIKGLIYTNIDSAERVLKSALNEPYIKGNKRYLTVLNRLAGNMYYSMGDYTKELFHQKESLRLAEEVGDDNYKAMALGNMGILYDALGNYAKSLDYQFKALKLFEKTKNKKGIANTKNNIGIVYARVDNFKLANTFFVECLEIYKDLRDSFAVTNALNNLAQNYTVMRDYKKAEFYIQQNMKFAGLHNILTLSMIYSNLAEIKSEQGLSDEAIDLYKRSLAFKQELKSPNGIATVSSRLGSVYSDKKDFAKGLRYLNYADSIYSSMGDTVKLCDLYLRKHYLYQEMGNTKLALDYYVKYHEFYLHQVSVREYDKIYNLKTNFELDEQEKELNEKARLEKVRFETIANEEAKRKNLIIGSVIAGLILVFVFLVIVYNRFKVTRTQNQIIEEQKRIVEEQKHVVEEKQKEIIDSINYAKRIQYTLLAHADFLKENLPAHFVYFHPKDIVSGDFYWAAKRDNKFYLAVCDSTGHGVPGAFMSLLNIGFLSEAINEKGMEEPGEVLDYVRERLITNISKEGQQDGFDGILICMDTESNQIRYAAANNAPLLVRDGAYAELAADRMPVGIGERKECFKTYVIEKQAGDLLFLYTDGYADQFGGPKGKKFKYKALNELLLKHAQKQPSEQKAILSEEFENWRGSLEQIDDVCVIGIRL